MTAIVKKKRHSRQTLQDRILDILFYIIVGVFMLCCFYPVYFVILASVSSSTAVNSGAMLLWPVDFHITGYEFVFSDVRIITGYTNTIMYTLGGTVIGLIFSLMAGYSLSRKDLPFRNAIMMIMVFTMYFHGGMIPTYLVIKNLGLINTRAVLIILGCVSVYNIILIRTFFQSNLPDELYEAAIIDGANGFQRVIHITIPCIISTILVTLILRLGSLMDAGFEQVLLLYNPSVYSVGDILDTYVYRNGLGKGQFSLTTAAGLFKGVVGLILVGGSNAIVKRMGEEGLW